MDFKTSVFTIFLHETKLARNFVFDKLPSRAFELSEFIVLYAKQQGKCNKLNLHLQKNDSVIFVHPANSRLKIAFNPEDRMLW